MFARDRATLHLDTPGGSGEGTGAGRGTPNCKAATQAREEPAVDATGPDLLPHLPETDAASRRLLAGLAELSDAHLRAPSLLPGWTRGHVVTHLCRNADAVTNLVEWAATGDERPMYASQAARDAAIEAGAGRPVAEQLADAEESAERFLAAARDLPAERWDTE